MPNNTFLQQLNEFYNNRIFHLIQGCQKYTAVDVVREISRV